MRHHLDPKHPSPDEMAYLQYHYTVSPDLGIVCNKQGLPVGHTNSHGYVVISGLPTGIGRNRKKHLRSHIIWWAKTGKWPTHMIDHGDTCRTNDCFSNLVESNNRDNMSNRSKQRDLPTGVSRGQTSNRFEARINIGGRMKFLGSFATPEEAGHAYTQAKAQLQTNAPEDTSTSNKQERNK